ncbi:MAG: hypothetical protein ACKV1O_25660 [Saprospiraceae bacterium]
MMRYAQPTLGCIVTNNSNARVDLLPQGATDVLGENSSMQESVKMNSRNLIVYPSIVSQGGLLNIKVTEDSGVSNTLSHIIIFDSFGRVVYSSRVNEVQPRISLFNFTSGMHIAQVILENGDKLIGKFLVE